MTQPYIRNLSVAMAIPLLALLASFSSHACDNPVIATNYCLADGNVSLTASAAASYSWNTGSNEQSITVNQAGIYSVTTTDAGGCTASSSVNVGGELVTNGNFSNGNTGFTSNYGYSSNLLPEGLYYVTNNAGNTHPNFYGYDHTSGAAHTGNFMVVNGSGFANTLVWGENIAVTPNTTYYFSTWVQNVDGGSPGELQFSINGVQLGNVFSVPSPNFTWTRFFISWNSGSNTTANITIVNQNTTAGGNDFGLDDISFSTLSPVSFSASATSTAATCNASANGSTVLTVTGGATPYTFAWSNGATSKDLTAVVAGNYTVTVTDANGCTTTASTTVSVSDNVPPTIVCQPDVTAYTSTNSCSAVVMLTTPSVSDNCNLPGAPALDQTSPDGGYVTDPLLSDWQSFTAGVTGNLTSIGLEGWDTNISTGYTLNIYAGTGTGGALLSTQSVTFPFAGYGGILTNIALSTPLALTQGQVYTLAISNSTAFRLIGYPWASYSGGIGSQTTLQPGWGGMDFHFATYVATSTGAVATSNHPSTTYPLGVTTVTWTATDAAGNTATCNQNVTVVDATPPTITCPGNMTATVNANGCKAVVNYSVNYADNCSMPTINQTTGLPSGSAFPKGVTTNTFVVTDASGNTATCSFTVTVSSTLAVNAGVNEQTYYGYSADQTVTHTAVATGGTAPYTYAWSLSRPLKCNQVNSTGDETFTAGTCGNNVCGANSTTAAAPSCTGSATVSTTLTDDADVCVTVTDAYGCTATSCFHINSEDARCFAGTSTVNKVKVCHKTGSATNPWVQICVAQAAISAHLSENPGDYLGNCGARLDESDIVSTGSGSFGMIAYPNPAKNSLNLEFETSASDAYRVSMFDVTGRMVYSSEGVTFKEGNKISFPLEGIPDGMYLVRLTVGNKASSVRVVVTQ